MNEVKQAIHPALVFGDGPAAPSTSNFEKEVQEHFKGRTHKEPDWQARLRTERWDLIHKIEALRVKLADPVFTSQDVDEDTLALMDEQFQTMCQYLDIVSRRMKLLGMALEDEPSPLGELREVGGFDEDRDGPVPFK